MEKPEFSETDAEVIRFVDRILAGSKLPPRLAEEARQDFVTHLEAAIAAWRDRGCSEGEARRRAFEQFGEPRFIRKRLVQLGHGSPPPPARRLRQRFRGWWQSVGQDARVALRSYRRQPLIPSIIVLTVAVGIGAVLAVFAVVNAVLIKPLPYPAPDELVAVGVTPGDDSGVPQVTSPGNFIDLRERATTFSGLAAYTPFNMALTGDGEAERVTGMLVSWDFFQTLGIAPLHGRTFRAEEEQPSAGQVVVLSHGLWQRRYGGRADIIGRTLTVNEQTVEIIGVMPGGFRVRGDADLWAPLTLVPGQASRGSNFLSVLGRMQPDVTLEEVRADVALVADRLHAEFPQFFGDQGLSVVPFRDYMVGRVETKLLFVSSAVFLVLLVVCANVANLLVVRTESRSAEIAVRMSLGADRARVTRQFVTEGLLLTGMGGLLGLGVAAYAVRVIIALGPTGIPRLHEVSVDPTVTLAAASIITAVGVIVSVAPVIRIGRRDLMGMLIGGRGALTKPGDRFRTGAVVVQLAVCLALTVNAALLIRSFVNLSNVDPGIDAGNLLSFQVELNGSSYTDATRLQYFEEGVRRLEAVSGVRQAASAGFRPTTGGFTRRFALADRPVPPDGEYFLAAYNPVSASYFETLGIPVLRGRGFTSSDRTQAPAVAVVNAAFVREYYSQSAPLGQRLGFYANGVPQPNAIEIVGVVGDVHFDALDQQPRPAIYIPHPQSPWRWGTFYARTEGDPSAIIPAARRAFAELDPNQPVFSVLPMDAVFAESTAAERLMTMLLSAFGVVALILALSGVFGIASFVVSHRMREFGLRIALGARPERVVSDVMRGGVPLVLAGLVLGIGGAFATGRLLEGALFQISALDPLTYAVAILLLVGGTLVAMYLPARKVSAIDPIETLRAE